MSNLDNRGGHVDIAVFAEDRDMDLTDIQKQAVIKWTEDGLGLSDIQKMLESEFGVKLTYMDVRFLVLELECQIQDKEEPVKDAADNAVAQGAAAGAVAEEPGTTPAQPDTPAGLGGVSVELDRVVKAGAVVSGTVVFSDGVKAAWAVDNMGRMVLDAGDHENYRPSQEDIQAFQAELKRLITERGY